MDWKTTLEEILAERRQRFGERPTVDELIALRAGELPEEDHQRLLEHAAVDREVARELFDVLRFPERSGDEDPGPEERGVGRRWRALRARLVAEGDLPAKDVASRPAPRRPVWLPLAAMFLLGVAATLTVGRLRGPGGPGPASGPRVNLPIVELLPVAGESAGVRGSAAMATLAADASGLVLALAVPGLVPSADRGPYALEIVRSDGTAVAVEGLSPGAGGVFVLEVPRGVWTDGLHELRLSDRDGQLVARFRLEVELRR